MEKDASEIAKLTERIAKDPKSKLFVPLAEEYKKAGNIDMAINVLQDGLKNNPGYITARSFLGRLLMDSGDLAGAQKELEEVIKTIPDNLLAQRKLGDLYVIIGRASDALQRYKTALGLNPGDKEVASLIADIEAGKDVSARIPRPKVSQQPAKAGQPAAKPAAATPAPPKPAVPAVPQKPVSPAPSVARPTAAPATKPAVVASPMPEQQAPAVPAAAVKAPTTAQPESTVPAAESPASVEEIIELEPLEQQVPSTKQAAPPVTPSEIPEQTVQVAKPSAPAAAPLAATLPSVETPVPQGAEEGVPVPAAQQEPPPQVFEEPSVFEEPVAGAFDLSEQGAMPDFVEPQVEGSQDGAIAWEAAEPEVVAVPEAPSVPEERAAESGDDINTNTLAELYITQGFYEKAIEIYEGMLAENPSNSALQTKLDKIRAMAGVAEQNAAFVAPETTLAEETPKRDIFAQPAVPAAERESATPAAPERVVSELPGKPEREKTVTQPKPPVQAAPQERVPEVPAGVVQTTPEVRTAPPAAVVEERVLTELPRKPELVKPSAPPKPPVQTMPQMQQKKATEMVPPAVPQGASARRKETIDRLESWLKNIIKEKP